MLLFLAHHDIVYEQSVTAFYIENAT